MVHLKGDTVIGDQACKKMYIEGLSGNTPNYYAAFYEKNKQVYEYPKDSDKPVLTFDHFMKVGEKKMFFGQEQEVIRIDTLKSCNHNFQVVFLYNNTGTSDGLTIVIGGLGGTLYNMFSPTNMVGATNTLVTCEQDGQMIYSTSDINSFVYEEVVGRWFGEWLVKRVQTDVHEPQRPIAVNSTDSLFDLQGRRLQGEPRKGIYVKGGRKFLRK